MLSTKAIVLRTIRYSDSSLIVSLYTLHLGMITSMVRISKSSKSKGSIAQWQLLNILELNIDYRANSEFQKISDVNISSPWMDIPYNPLKASISMFLADFLFNSLRGEGENYPLFAFLENSLGWLDEANTSVANFHLVLMLKMTRFIGILPSIDGYAKEKYYDLKSATYSSSIPPHGQYLEPEEASVLPYLLLVDYAYMHRLKMSRKERWHMLEVLLLYYHLHVPSFGELKSLDILRESFS